MCDCGYRVHPGIECGGPGCVCHEDRVEDSFERELTALLNKHSQENSSGTPDWILANYLIDCLDAYNTAVGCRAEYRGESVELHLQAIADIPSEEEDD